MADRAAIQAERDLQSDISQAVRETEEEIFAGALGTEEPERDDTSLEEMADDRLEGDETIDDDIDEEPPEEQPVESEPEAPAAEADPRDAQIAELRAQIAAISQRMQPQQFQPPQPQFQQAQQAPPQYQPQPQYQPSQDAYRNPYDNVLEPDKYHQHNVQVMQQIVADHLRMTEEGRVNALLEQTRTGERGVEFQLAYNYLTTLPPAERIPVANRMRYAADPGGALLDWWDKTPQAREIAQAEEARMTEFLQQRGYQVRPTGNARQQAAVAPRGRMPPSLNAIPGGRSHRAQDADNRLTMGDQVDGLPLGDDSAIFANVWRTS